MLRAEVTMRWLAALGLLVLLPSVADAGKRKKKAAAEAQPIELPCGYVPGEVHRYRYEKVVRKDLPDGATTRTTRFDLGIQVVSFDGTTSVLDVTSGPIEILGSDPTDPVTGPMMAALSRYLTEERPIVARYSTNHTTTESSVLNVDELMPVFLAIMDEAWRGMKAADPTLPDSMGDMMRSMMTPELVTKSVHDDMGALVGFTCGALLPSVTYETLLPNALGGEPFPASGTLTTTAKGDVVVVSVEESIDPESVAAILEPILSKTLPPGSPELEEMLRSMAVHVETDLEVVVHAATGWPTGWQSERVAKVSMNGEVMPGGRVDTVACSRLGEG